MGKSTINGKFQYFDITRGLTWGESYITTLPLAQSVISHILWGKTPQGDPDVTSSGLVSQIAWLHVSPWRKLRQTRQLLSENAIQKGGAKWK